MHCTASCGLSISSQRQTDVEGLGAQMNTLAALQTVAERVGTPGEALLEGHRPRTYAERVNGRSLAAAGCEPILHMRAFQKQRRLPDALVSDILARAESLAAR